MFSDVFAVITISLPDLYEPLAVSVVNDETVGAVVSILIVFEPNIDDAAGKAVDVMAFPAVSATVPIKKLLTVKPEEVSPVPTVYVPTNVVPAFNAFNTTVSLVSNVTVIVIPL